MWPALVTQPLLRSAFPVTFYTVHNSYLLGTQLTTFCHETAGWALSLIALSLKVACSGVCLFLILVSLRAPIYKQCAYVWHYSCVHVILRREPWSVIWTGFPGLQQVGGRGDSEPMPSLPWLMLAQWWFRSSWTLIPIDTAKPHGTTSDSESPKGRPWSFLPVQVSGSPGPLPSYLLTCLRTILLTDVEQRQTTYKTGIQWSQHWLMPNWCFTHSKMAASFLFKHRHTQPHLLVWAWKAATNPAVMPSSPLRNHSELS